MSENIKVDIDTTGLSNLVTSLKTEYDKYVLSADNLSKEIENIVNCWNGPDCDAYMIKARANVIDMWLVSANVPGINPIMFNVRMNKNKEKTNGTYFFPLSPRVP